MNVANPTPATAWTKEEVEALLRAETLGYQKIDLPYGLSTSGDDRSSTCGQIFPGDLSGKTVLDIGSLSGYFCFEALKRGAQAALGIEVNPDFVRKAGLLADCLGLAPEFRVADIEHDAIEGPFDYVLCLNVLHHLKNPLATLEKLIRLTRERLVLEVASMGARDRRKLKISRLAAYFLKRAPVLYVQNTGRGASGQTFFITPRAIQNLLLEHRKMFASVAILPSKHKDRFLAVAEKRRLGTLLVVAGPTSAGKSTLIRRLGAGELPELAQRLGLGDWAKWKMTTTGGLGKLTEARVEQLLFEYDISNPYFKSAQTYERHEPLDILGCAERIVFLTLWTSPERLQRQIDQSEILPHTRGGVFRGNRRHLKVREKYQDPRNVCQYYLNWLAFTRRYTGAHHVVSAGDELTFHDVPEWEATLSKGAERA